MKKKVSSVLLSLALTIGVAFGQGFTFKVLANKGQNKVKKASGEVTVLKTGALLYEGEELLSSSDAYIGLMHKSGKTAEIRGQGSNKVADLASKINTKKTSAASRYAQFIAAKMNEGDKNSLSSRTNTTGAVTRAVDGGSIEVLLPSSVDVFSSDAVVRWRVPKDVEEGSQYIVTIKNIFDEEIFTQETDKTHIDLNFDDMENESGLYILNVVQKDNAEVASGDYGIKKVNASDKPDIAENLTALTEEVAQDSPLSKVVLATFFEENALLLDALTMYEEAIQLSPEVESFRELYEDFLVKNGIVKVEE